MRPVEPSSAFKNLDATSEGQAMLLESSETPLMPSEVEFSNSENESVRHGAEGAEERSCGDASVILYTWSAAAAMRALYFILYTWSAAVAMRA